MLCSLRSRGPLGWVSRVAKPCHPMLPITWSVCEDFRAYADASRELIMPLLPQIVKHGPGEDWMVLAKVTSEGSTACLH